MPYYMERMPMLVLLKLLADALALVVWVLLCGHDLGGWKLSLGRFALVRYRAPLYIALALYILCVFGAPNY